MKTNVSFENLVNHLVEVFQNADLLQDYNNEGVSYQSFAEWFDLALAPLSRGAYVETFGADVLRRAEISANDILKEREYNTEHSNYSELRAEAEANGNECPKAGNYYLAYASNIATGGHVLNELDLYLRAEESEININAEVVCVGDVITVDPDIFADADKLPELLESYINEKGETVPCGSVEIDNADTLLAGSGNSYINVFAVVCGSRWFFVDTEGHGYAKYILLPCNYSEMYGDELAELQKKNEREQEEEEEREAREKTKRRAEYEKRCARWWSLMRDVRPLKKAADATPYAYGNTPEAKAYKKAQRELLNARRANIIAMINAIYPGLKVSVTTRKGWGNDYLIQYTDGPSEDEFKETLDLDLFCSAWDTFCGYDDSTGREYSEFTDFANYTMCGCDGNIDVSRTISTDKETEIITKVSELLGVTDIKHFCTGSESDIIADNFALSSNTRYYLANGRWTLRDAAAIVARHLSYWDTPADAATDPATVSTDAPAVVSDTQTVAAPATDEQEAAPAEGLDLVEIAGGVAVVGNSRTTYKNRKEIKAHGAKWNKEAQQWQATTPEDVATLRAWFALRDVAAAADEQAAAVAPAVVPAEVVPAPVVTIPQTRPVSLVVSAAPSFAAAAAVEDVEYIDAEEITDDPNAPQSAAVLPLLPDVAETTTEQHDDAEIWLKFAECLENIAVIVSGLCCNLRKDPDNDEQAAPVRPEPFTAARCASWSSRAASGDLSRVLGEICAALASLVPDMANIFNYYGMGFYSGDFDKVRPAYLHSLAALVRSVPATGDPVADFIESLAA